jgi:hypothetical protein
VGAVRSPDADEVARRFGLGAPRGPLTYAARGELGRIWRLDTDRGAWAVKESIVPLDEDAAAADVAFQRAAAAAGLPLPRPVPAADGRIVVEDTRVYAWVDLDPVVPATPADLGAVAAHLHRVGHADLVALDAVVRPPDRPG